MAQTADGPSGRYAPIDWIYTRPHGRIVADAGTDDRAVIKLEPYHTGEINFGSFTKSALLYSQDHLGRSTRPPDSNAFQWEGVMVQAVRQFAAKGRNVFHLDAAMTESLRNVDLGDATVEELVHPYDCYYLRFDGPDYVLPSGETLDGVMVNRVMARPDGETIESIQRKVMEIVTARMTNGQGIDMKDVNEVSEELNTVPVLTLTFMPRRSAAWPDAWPYGFQCEMELTDPKALLVDSLVDNAGKALEGGPVTAEMREESLWYRPIPDLRGWTELIVNTILYLTRYAGDQPKEWQPDGPSDLVDRANAGRRPAEKELARLGFVRTRFIRFGGGGDDTPDAQGGSVRPHWRRGHWRRQPHGERNALRKLVLIRPVRVGWKDGGDHAPHMGRTYRVDRQS